MPVLGYDFKALAASTYAPYAQAISVGQAGQVTEKLALPVEYKETLNTHINTNNPLDFFARDIRPAEVNHGSVELKWDGELNVWREKTGFGRNANGIDETSLKREVHLWGKPFQKSEGIWGYDLKKGAVDLLAERAVRDIKRYVQNSIRNGFAVAAAKDGVITRALARDYNNDGTGSVQDKAAALLLELTTTATEFIKLNEVSKDELTYVIDPILFDKLSFAGLIGNRADVAFAGGQYVVGTAGGYKFASGEIFLPATVASTGTAAAFGVVDTTTPAADKAVLGYLGTSDSLLHNISLISQTMGTVDNTEDLETYLEIADIAAVPTRTVEQKLLAIIHAV